MADEVRKGVLEKLQLVNVEKLNESCGRLQLTVSENKKGNKRALFNNYHELSDVRGIGSQ